jgi:hypothetical protein
MKKLFETGSGKRQKGKRQKGRGKRENKKDKQDAG